MALFGDSVRSAAARPRLYLICGPAGSGKSVVARALAVRLGEAGAEHRLFDRYGPDESGSWYGHDAPVRHLRQLCREGVEEGASALVVTWPLRTQAELAELRIAMPWVELWVCRLRASESTLTARITARESGFMRLHLHTLALEAAGELDASGLGDCVLDTDVLDAGAAAEALLHAAPRPVAVSAGRR